MISVIINIVLTFVVLYVLIRIYARLVCARCVSKASLVGKIAVVTGGSSGIGYEIALDLACRGCKVIIADIDVNEDIKKNLIRETLNPNISLEFVDLASFNSVRRLANTLKGSEQKLDILINNAGVIIGPRSLTEDGLNSTYQINYFSGFLLTHLLVDLLKKSPSSRVIWTSSLAAFLNNVSLHDELNEKTGGEMSCYDYHNSKFMQIVAADIFAKKLNDFKITSNSFHPGIVKSPLIKKTDEITVGFMEIFNMWCLRVLLFFLHKTPEEGAQTAIHLAVSREAEDVTGTFYGEAAPRKKPRAAYNGKLCERIWSVSEGIVKLSPEEKL